MFLLYYIAVVIICLLSSIRHHHNLTVVASVEDTLYTRYDRDAYLKKRYGDELTTQEDDINNSKTYPTTKQDIIKLLNTPPLSPSTDDDPEQKCTTYLAPSSIPNSGLGMYTTIPYASGESFPFPEIGIMLQEMKRHAHHTTTSDTKKKKTKLLSQYPWAAKVLTFGKNEVGYGESIVPSLGMLANSHLGLVNVRHSELWNTQPALDGTSSISTQYTNSLTLDDVGRGAISHHSNVKFESSKKIEAGEELFVSYGDEWFVKRENIIGIVPGASHFIEADQILLEFVNQHPNVGDGGDVGTINYELLLRKALQKDKRLHAAFPKSVHDVHKAVEMGTARFSAKESVRSTEWLEENGACIDNIISGITAIPQAGKGSFATRQINDGGVITTTPLITLERDQLYLWEDVKQSDDGSVVKELVGHQLLLNYCYGHKDSSLLFFPYSPSINFINHGMNKEDINAKIRWSTYPYHKKEWLDLSLQDMKDQLHTGLMFDIVATRDIQRGEEILLDYGSDWVESWKEHANEWRIQMDEEEDEESIHQFNMTDRLDKPTTVDLNIIHKHPIVRTEAEQQDDPYPPYIMTRCRFEPPSKEKAKYAIGTKMSREFHDKLLGITRAYSGKVIKYDAQTKMYSILYDEDGDEEEVSEEVLDTLATDTTTSQEDSEEGGDCGVGKPIRWTLKYDDMHIFPCKIQTRTSINDMDWYTALVEVATTSETTTDDDDKKKKTTTTTTRYHRVEYMPRYAILFVDKPYTKDQYAQNTFRHEIGLPDGIMPEYWLDLKDNL